jgi:nitroimidazol reductase NimA-like FMN-containing flavoprotein (pyridoxamine 5'-phosphate oxidase superfamily)
VLEICTSPIPSHHCRPRADVRGDPLTVAAHRFISENEKEEGMTTEDSKRALVGQAGTEGRMTGKDPGTVARSIIDANLYMVLATADEAGRPWASPVYFANSGYAEFFWVSSPEATHSRNIAVRPRVGIVIFNSQAPIGTGQGVYMPALAEEIADTELERGIHVFSRRSLAHGGVAWTPDDVRGRAPIRLYRATVAEHSILAKDGRPDHRIAADVNSPWEPGKPR